MPTGKSAVGQDVAVAFPDVEFPAGQVDLLKSRYVGTARAKGRREKNLRTVEEIIVAALLVLQ